MGRPGRRPATVGNDQSGAIADGVLVAFVCSCWKGFFCFVWVSFFFILRKKKNTRRNKYMPSKRSRSQPVAGTGRTGKRSKSGR